MRLTINGEARDADGVLTVRDLVERLGFAGRAVAVEVNRRVVRKRDHGQTALREGDRVEVVTLVGGG